MADPQSQNLPPIGQPLPDNGQYTFGSSTSQTNGNLPPIGKPLDESQYTFGPSNQIANQNINTQNAQPRANSIPTGIYESAIKPAVDLGRQMIGRPIDLYHQAVDAFENGDWKTGSTKALQLTGILPDKDSPLFKAAESLVMQPVDHVIEGYKANRKAGMGPIESAVAPANKNLNTPESQNIARSIPVLGNIVGNVDDLISKHLGAKEYKSAAGNILGTILSLGMSGEAPPSKAAAANDVSENLVRPGVKNIAGVDVPVATPNSETQGTLSRTVQRGATAAGAQHFIDNYTQPAAVNANTNNIGQAVMRSADEIRTLRGEPLTAQNPPVINSVDDAADFLKKEAKPTYSALDKAAQPDIQAWQRAKDTWDRQNPPPTKPNQGPTPFTGTKPTATENSAQRASYKAKLQNWTDEQNDWLENNPQPKTFTQLQDQLTNAQDTLDSKFSSQVDKESATKNLPVFKREMDDFLNTHSDVVDPDELKTANKLWGQSKQMEWLADRVRTATTGTKGTPSMGLKQSPLNLNREQLVHLPSQFDNKFGKGSWSNTLGPDGVKNYNAIVDALKNPVSGEMPLNLFLHEHWLGTYLKGASLTGPIANTILFNPTAGQAVLKLWKAAPKMAANASVVGQAAKTPDTTPVKRAVYNTATGLAGNGQ